ncbi:MAG: hypothetical protein IKW74_06555 [Thermoguttaceae bacterium]|nr:hypothetical protein [Thermoguttaceae bacterium]
MFTQASENGTKVVRVIIDNRVGMTIDFIQKILLQIDDAYFANYLY